MFPAAAMANFLHDGETICRIRNGSRDASLRGLVASLVTGTISVSTRLRVHGLE